MSEILDLLRSINDRLGLLVDAQGTGGATEDLVTKAIAMLVTDGTNVSKIARTLGVDRRTLYRKRAFVQALEQVQSKDAMERQARRGQA